MLKKDLVDKIAATGLTKKQAGAALEAVLDAISDSLKKGEPVLLTGFGKFEVRTIQNVIGYIHGSIEPDRYVIIGNHFGRIEFRINSV